jgi:hypothetical protein
MGRFSTPLLTFGGISIRQILTLASGQNRSLNEPHRPLFLAVRFPCHCRSSRRSWPFSSPAPSLREPSVPPIARNAVLVGRWRGAGAMALGSAAALCLSSLAWPSFLSCSHRCTYLWILKSSSPQSHPWRRRLSRCQHLRCRSPPDTAEVGRGCPCTTPWRTHLHACKHGTEQTQARSYVCLGKEKVVHAKKEEGEKM